MGPPNRLDWAFIDASNDKTTLRLVEECEEILHVSVATTEQAKQVWASVNSEEFE